MWDDVNGAFKATLLMLAGREERVYACIAANASKVSLNKDSK